MAQPSRSALALRESKAKYERQFELAFSALGTRSTAKGGSSSIINYTPLTNGFVRVVDLEADSTKAIPKCRLRHICLGAESYTALSHVWNAQAYNWYGQALALPGKDDAPQLRQESQQSVPSDAQYDTAGSRVPLIDLDDLDEDSGTQNQCTSICALTDSKEH